MNKSEVQRGIKECPACGCTKNTPIGQIATAFESLAGGKVYHQPAYRIRYCQICDLYFKSHTLALEELEDYYSRLECESFEFDRNFPTDRILRRELEKLPIGSKVLDFGCSTGRILKNYTERLNCIGFEVNDRAADIARNRSIQILSKEDLQAYNKCDFDAILLTDVYEHLAKPVELISMLTTILKPNGWLAIVTGNGDAVPNRDIIGEFWYFRILGHFQMISERHLYWLSKKLNLTVDTLHRCSHYDTTVKEQIKQYFQALAYRQFRYGHPRISALLRFMPFIKRAERWSNAPPVSYTADHVVAIFRKN